MCRGVTLQPLSVLIRHPEHIKILVIRNGFPKVRCELTGATSRGRGSMKITKATSRMSGCQRQRCTPKCVEV
jgi:hypothetical protein